MGFMQLILSAMGLATMFTAGHAAVALAFDSSESSACCSESTMHPNQTTPTGQLGCSGA